MAVPLILAAIGRGIAGLGARAATTAGATASRSAAFTESAGNAIGKGIRTSAMRSGDNDSSSSDSAPAPAPDLSQSVTRTAQFQIGRG